MAISGSGAPPGAEFVPDIESRMRRIGCRKTDFCSSTYCLWETPVKKQMVMVPNPDFVRFVPRGTGETCIRNARRLDGLVP